MSTQQYILRLLIEADQPLSGQQLANQLGLSRNAIWKAIEQLRQQGYQIENIPKKGYQLLKVSTQLDATQITQGLSPLWQTIDIQVFDQVTSTNDLAKQYAIEHPGQAALFVASEQTNGRGRSGRSFHSQIAHGLYLSLVFRPVIEDLRDIPQLTLVAASAIVEALEQLTALNLQIKWVNDLFYAGRKIGGILTEATTDIENQSISALIIGIGLNLAGSFAEASPQAQQVAGTLFGEQSPADFNPNQLLHLFLNQMADYMQQLDKKNYLTTYQQHLLGIGQQVSYQWQGAEHSGTIEGINPSGHLLVRDNNNQLHTLFSQEVHFSSHQFIQKGVS